MSLLQLLTVGHSLVNYKDQLSPYRITRDIRLPKFGPTTHAGPDSGSSSDLKTDAPAGSAAYPQAPKSPAMAKPPGRWDMKPKAQPASSTPPVRGGNRASARLCQGELALDQVKVVRNDLRESDIVVVPTEQPDSAHAPFPLPLAADTKPHGSRWNGVMARFFSAGGILL